MLEYQLEIIPLPEGIITEKLEYRYFIDMRDGLKLSLQAR